MPKLTSDTMLSCSQLPAVMGFSPWAKANDTLQFCVTAIDGGDPRTPAGEAADWGNLLEKTILQEMADRLGLAGWYAPDEAYKATEDELACSLDGVGTVNEPLVIHHAPENGIYVMDSDSITLQGQGILESKLTRGAPEDSPALYRGPIQIQGQMICTGMEWAALGVLYSGVELRIFLYRPHHETQEAIKDIAHQFAYKLHVYRQAKEIHWFPPSDSKDADRIWSHPADDMIDLDDDIEAIADQIITLKDQKRFIEEQVTEAELKIKKLMQDHAKAKAGKFVISWPMRHYKATAEKITPAKEAYSIRQSTLTIKESK